MDFDFPLSMCLSASLIEHSFVKSAVFFAICQSIDTYCSLFPFKREFLVLINHWRHLVFI